MWAADIQESKHITGLNVAERVWKPCFGAAWEMLLAPSLP